MLACPICTLALRAEERRAVCPKGHSFDRARQGHFNFLTNSSSKGHGDSMEMLLSRRRFLEAGYYDMLAEAVAEKAEAYFPREGVLLDAGCGEGYYTQRVADRLAAAGKKSHLFAFDIAKDAARLTAVRMKKRGFFFAASTFKIPMMAESVDLAMSLFAPYSEEEFLRVLKKGGYLLRAVPLEEHLYSLKCAVYASPTKNQAMARIGERFRLVSQERIRGEISLGSQEDIMALFGMTPYAHKTGLEDMEKLKKLEKLTTEVDFGVLLYEKKY